MIHHFKSPKNDVFLPKREKLLIFLAVLGGIILMGTLLPSLNAAEDHPFQELSLKNEASSPSEIEGIPRLLPYFEVLGRVICQSDFPLSSMEEIRTEIQNLQTDLIEYLAVPEPTEQVVICVFNERSSYVDFLRANCPQAPTNRPALYIKDDGPGYVFLQRDENLILNLRHEMTHAILNASLKNVPIWLDEGLAKYFETPAGQRGWENPFLPTVAEKADSFLASVPSLANLERLTRIDQMGPTQYRDSWAWIHFLIHYSPETQRLLGIYLRSLRPENQREASEPDASFFSFLAQKPAPLTALLKKELPDYKKRYKDHFSKWSQRP